MRAHPGPRAGAPADVDRLGPYQLERKLGSDGFAEVYMGKVRGAEGFSRQVAIKRVVPALAANPAVAAQFVAEATLLARLCHPNIVSVLDFERDPEHGLFLVLEPMHGCELRRLMAAGPVPLPLAVHVTLEILGALAYAHALPLGERGRGVVHRGVSPTSVLLSWEGEVKLTDFGIAKQINQEIKQEIGQQLDARDVHGAAWRGDPAYVSPEQSFGGDVDGRADLFAVGAVLWELLVGRPLFQRATAQDSRAATRLAPIPPPRALCPWIPEALSDVTMRLLARPLAQRYASAEDAIDDLRACGLTPLDAQREVISLLCERFAEEAPARWSRRSTTQPQLAPARRGSPRAWWATWRTAASLAVVGALAVTMALQASTSRRAPHLGALAPGVVAPGALAPGRGGAPARATQATSARAAWMGGRSVRDASLGRPRVADQPVAPRAPRGSSYGRHTAPGPSAMVTQFVPVGQVTPGPQEISHDLNSGPAGPAMP